MDLMSDLIVATRRGDKLMAETNPGGGGGHHQQGILLDRATSVIIGETDIVGDNVSIHNRQTAGDWKVIACLAAHKRRQGAQRRAQHGLVQDSRVLIVGGWNEMLH
jgi:hypothetical protein